MKEEKTLRTDYTILEKSHMQRYIIKTRCIKGQHTIFDN